MGDRARIIILNEVETVGDQNVLVGLNLYTHWDAVKRQRDAIAAVLTYGLNRVYDKEYFNRIVIRAFTNGDDGEYGSGVLPFIETGDIDKSFATLEDFDAYVEDDNPVVLFDLARSRKTVWIYKPDQRHYDLITYDLNEEGLKYALEFYDGEPEE